ncbi:MAG: hypothetical protein FWD17_05570, partial [Polyangiaceae bacterium]|nr:hypothetical protein [Polyangiaceae bacterium]
MRASRSGVGQCVAVCVATCVAVACNTGPHVLGAQTTGAAVVPADGGAASTLADGSTGSLARGDASTTLGNDGGSFPTPAACAGGGPAVTVNGGSGSQCTGLVAQTNFTFSVCSCKDARLEAQTLIDGWNSAAGPYTPGQIGGGLGADGAITADDDADIWGQAWAASTSTAFTVDSSMTVHSDLHSGGNIETSDLEVSGDAYVAGNINDSITVAKTLYQPSGKSAGDSTYGTRVVQPVT